MNGYRIDLRQHSTHCLYSTVRVHINYENNATGSGTAFFFRCPSSSGDEISYLVTNNHVIEEAITLNIQFHICKNPTPWDFTIDKQEWITIHNPSALWVPHPDKSIDLCAISLPLLQNLYPQLNDIFFTPMASTAIPSHEEEMRYHAMMNIAMIGYPIGLWDEKNNLPLMRSGITASHPAIDFDGKPEVLVDVACFPGSSGSPLIYNDQQYFASSVRFLGILYAGPTFTLDSKVTTRKIPTKLGRSSQVDTMIHLGYVIKAKKLLELVRYIQGMSPRSSD